MLFTVLFAAGRWDLDERARATVREIVAGVRVRRQAERGLVGDRRYVLNVVGYSDTVGSAPASQRVSELRAMTVGCAPRAVISSSRPISPYRPPTTRLSHATAA
jgi:outer membrane protein OmpA-like peptidoglycan-associated protein